MKVLDLLKTGVAPHFSKDAYHEIGISKGNERNPFFKSILCLTILLDEVHVCIFFSELQIYIYIGRSYRKREEIIIAFVCKPHFTCYVKCVASHASKVWRPKSLPSTTNCWWGFKVPLYAAGFLLQQGVFGYKFHGFPDFQFQWYLCFNWNIPIFMDIMDLRFKSTLSLWYSNFIFWIFSIKNAEKCKTWDPATGTLPETNSQLETTESWCSWKKSLLSASFWSRMPSF